MLSCKEAIKNSRMFWQLSDSQIDKLAALCREEYYEAGASVFLEGTTARDFYIVEEGKVALEMEIRIGSRTKRRIITDVITPGEVFGWTAFAEKPVHAFSATCTESTKLLVFRGENVLNLCTEDVDLYRKIMLQVVNIMADRLDHAKQTLGRVLSMTSHDLKAPLATAQSCLDVVLSGIAGEITDKQRDLLSGAKQRVADLIGMINNLLDISYLHLTVHDFQNVSLPAVVENSIADVQGPAQKKQIQIKNNMPADLPQVFGEPKRLQQVLTNLLINAIKFTSSGGTVTISSQLKNKHVQIEVCDNGMGISPEDLPKLFSDFYRGVHADAEGAGIGLSIAKKIVEAHGGQIWAESPCPETGIGSKFSFTIPLVEAAKTRAEEKEVVIQGARILVADDDPNMLTVLKTILESAGYEVITARDGEEALAKLKTEKPDLLILDLLMPKKDGFEVCKQLSEQEKAGEGRVPVMIMSAVREESSRQRYELETRAALGVDDYLEKPVSPVIVLQRVERILSKNPGRLNALKEGSNAKTS